MNKILIVDDVDELRDQMKWTVEKMTPRPAVPLANSAEDAYAIIENEEIDAIVTDLSMEKYDSGIEVLKRAKAKNPNTQVIVVTAFGKPDVSVKIMEEGAFDYVERNSPGLNFLEVLRFKVGLALDYKSRL